MAPKIFDHFQVLYTNTEMMKCSPKTYMQNLLYDRIKERNKNKMKCGIIDLSFSFFASTLTILPASSLNNPLVVVNPPPDSKYV